jgi:hypothetical protein
MILPLVLIGMLVLLAVSGAMQTVAWRSLRGARGQWDAQRGMYLADAAIVHTLATWVADSVAAAPIGSRRRTTATLADGWQTATTVARTAPLVAVIQAVARREHTGSAAARIADGARIRRIVTRTVWLQAPPLPLLAAATVLGHATVGASRLDGRDLPGAYAPAIDDCGVYRDTSSLPAVAARTVTVTGVATLVGTQLPLDSARLTSLQAEFDAAMALIRTRGRSTVLSAAGTVPRGPAWQAMVIHAPTRVTLDGPSSHVGLLAIDGDLHVRGSLRVEGMLLVQGALEVSGQLDVDGAVVVRDAAQRSTRLGDQTHVRYAPCLLARAAAAVAVPRSATFGVWNSP